MGQLEQITMVEPKAHADLTMTQVYAKIGMTQDIVYLEIAAFTYMTEVIIKQVGSWRRISKNLSEKDGSE